PEFRMRDGFPLLRRLRSTARQETSEESLVLAALAREGEVLAYALPAALPHPLPVGFRLEKTANPLSQNQAIAGRNEVAVHAIVNDLRRATDGCGDHGYSGR